MAMNGSQKRRAERRRQEEMDVYYERAALERKQALCDHNDCEVVSSYWNGLPKEVVCRECGEVNFLEDTEL